MKDSQEQEKESQPAATWFRNASSASCIRYRHHSFQQRTQGRSKVQVRPLSVQRQKDLSIPQLPPGPPGTSLLAPSTNVISLDALDARTKEGTRYLRHISAFLPSYSRILLDCADLVESSVQSYLDQAKEEVDNRKAELSKSHVLAVSKPLKLAMANCEEETLDAIKKMETVDKWKKKVLGDLKGELAKETDTTNALRDQLEKNSILLNDIMGQTANMYDAQAQLTAEAATLDGIEEQVSELLVVNTSLGEEKRKLEKILAKLRDSYDASVTEEIECVAGEMEGGAHVLQGKFSTMQRHVETASNRVEAKKRKLMELKAKNEALRASARQWESIYRRREAAELSAWTPRPDHVALFEPNVPTQQLSTFSIVESALKRLAQSMQQTRKAQEELVKAKRLFAPIAAVNQLLSTEPQDRISSNYLPPFGTDPTVPKFIASAFVHRNEKWGLPATERHAFQLLQDIAEEGLLHSSTAIDDMMKQVAVTKFGDEEVARGLANLVYSCYSYQHCSPICSAFLLVSHGRLPTTFIEAPLNCMTRILQACGGDNGSVQLKVFLQILTKEYLATQYFGAPEYLQARYAVLMDSATAQNMVRPTQLQSIGEMNRNGGLFFRTMIAHFLSRELFLHHLVEAVCMDEAAASCYIPGVLFVPEIRLRNRLEDLRWEDNDVLGVKGIKYSSRRLCSLQFKFIIEILAQHVEKYDVQRHYPHFVPPDQQAGSGNTRDRIVRKEKRPVKHELLDLVGCLSVLRTIPLKVQLAK